MSFIINILSTPAILVGLISLFGLILQKKPVEDVVKGTVKTIVGFLVLTAGSSFLQTGSLNDFGVIFNYAFNMQGVVPNNEAIVSLGLADFASDTAYIMCIGMIANIVLARFSRLHYIFLTGHHTLYMSAMLAIILNVGNLTGPMLFHQHFVSLLWKKLREQMNLDLDILVDLVIGFQHRSESYLKIRVNLQKM